MDVDAAMHGLDFVRVLDDKIAASDVLVVVIGPEWLMGTDPSGSRRIDNPRDFVRIELAAALQRNIPVIPVLVDGAAMPGEADLPAELCALSRRHAVELRNTRFVDDANTLVDVLSKRLGVTTRRLWPLPVAAALLLVVAASVTLVWLWPMTEFLQGLGVVDRTAPEGNRKAAVAKSDGEYRAQAIGGSDDKVQERDRLKEQVIRLETEARICAEYDAEDRRRRDQEEQLRRQREEEERQRQAPAAVPETENASLPICEQLWRQRNAIFRDCRFCFTTEKGVSIFGNAGCFRNQDQTWQAMGESNRELVRGIQRQERANAC